MKNLIEMLQKLQWVQLPFSGRKICPVCQCDEQHAEDCELGRMLSEIDASSDGVLVDLSGEASDKIFVSGGDPKHPGKEFLHIGSLKLGLLCEQMEELYRYFRNT